jgi:putative sterol carrier protein
MRDQAEKLRELNHTVLFDLGDDGKILLDATGGEVLVTPDPADDDAETTLMLSADNMVKLINGDLNPMAAFTMRKLKVFGSKGDRAQALKPFGQLVHGVARRSSLLTVRCSTRNEVRGHGITELVAKILIRCDFSDYAKQENCQTTQIALPL